MISDPPRLLFLLLCALTVFGVSGCERSLPSEDYVARVGSNILTREALSESLGSMSHGLDSTDASAQLVEQWVTSELLYREAMRRGLSNRPEVRRQITESERSVLISALVETLYSEASSEPTDSEIETYFNRHREQLRLVEPFVRIRYLVVSSQDSATVARRLLAALDSSHHDAWAALARRFSEDADASLDLARSYVAEGRLFTNQQRLREASRTLRIGRTTPAILENDRVHLVQLVDRVDSGTIPRISWIEGSLRQRLQIDARKQIYARQVQQIRNQALAGDVLEIR